MTTIADVRQGLADAAAVCGIPTYAYEADVITVPSLYVSRLEYDPRFVFSQAKAPLRFLIIGYFNRTPTETSLRLIDTLSEYTGDGSLTAAVQSSSNWGPTVDYASVTSVGRAEVVQIAGIEYLSVTFEVEVVF